MVRILATKARRSKDREAMRKDSTDPLYGIISAIVYQKKDKHRASIFIAGEFSFGVHVPTIEHFRLRKGDEVDSILYQKIRSFDETITARRVAQKYLNSRRRTEHDVRQRLARADIPEALIDTTIDELKAAKLIDDAAYAQAFIHDRLLAKPISQGKLAIELQAKGIARTVVQNAVSTVANEEDEIERALRAARKKLPALERREPDLRLRSQKLYAFLAGRGFSGATIRKSLNRLALDVEEDAL